MSVKVSSVAKQLLALIVLGVLFLLVDVRELWAALSQLTLRAIGCLFLVSIALIWVSAVKWGLFIRTLGERVPVARLFNLYLLGYFVNLILPSYLGGDAVRSWHVGKKIGQHEALAATILERYTGLVAMVALALIFMWQVNLVTPQIKLAVIVVAVGVVAVTIIASSSNLLSLVERISVLKPLCIHLRKIQDGLLFAGKNPKLLVQALLLSFCYHSLTVLNTIVCARAVGWSSPPLYELFVVLPLILLVGALPIAPNGLGIQEGAFFFFLHGIGATRAEALGVALILRAKSYVLALLGGAVWATLREKVPTS